MWWANNQFNVVPTDYRGRATGSNKALIEYVSRDGVSFLNRNYEADNVIEDRRDGIQFSDGSSVKTKIERPEVFLNAYNEVIALLVGLGYHDSEPPPDGEVGIAIIPVDNYYPISLDW